MITARARLNLSQKQAVEFKSESWIEQHSKLFKEPVHSEQSREGKLMGESRANRDDAAGRIQRNIVNIHTRNAIYSQSSLRVSLFNIQPDCLSNTGMENTTGGARINQGLKSFGAGRIPGGKRKIDIQNGGIRESPIFRMDISCMRTSHREGYPDTRSFQNHGICNSSILTITHNFGEGRTNRHNLALILRKGNPTIQRGGTQGLQA